ncbi:MAG: hypothetical protein AB1414_20285 [bacterium]
MSRGICYRSCDSDTGHQTQDYRLYLCKKLVIFGKPSLKLVTVQAIYQKCKKGDKEIRMIWR